MLRENGFALLGVLTGLDLNDDDSGAGKTTNIFTFPNGKEGIVTHIIIDGFTSTATDVDDLDFGVTDDTDAWNPNEDNDLEYAVASDDAILLNAGGVLDPAWNTKVFQAGEIFCVTVKSGDIAAAACLCNVRCFGFLWDQ